MKELTENQKIWLAALRSGDYKQGTLYLRTVNDTFCCLGVAADLFKSDDTEVELKGEAYIYDDNGCLAPEYVVNALGLKDRLGYCYTGGSLAAINDKGKTFAEIADTFEANLEYYTR